MKKKLELIFPGTILHEEFMEPLGITAYKLSKEIKVQQTAVSQIIRGSRRITVDMALRLSKYFSNSAQFWLNLQNNFDLESETEKKEYLIRDIVPYNQVAEKPIKTWAEIFKEFKGDPNFSVHRELLKDKPRKVNL